MQDRRVAVITGGASGFGLALGESCAARGLAVALLDIDGERVAEAAVRLANEHGVPVVGRRMDVASTADVEGAAADLRGRFGRCDLLWVNVGVQHFGAVESLSDEVWRWVLDVNVVGAVRTVRAFLPLLRAGESARIAFTASANVLAPAARLGAYQASKYGLVGLAETVRIEVASESIGVSIVYPSGMATRHLESSAAARPSGLEAADVTEDDLSAMVASRPTIVADVTTAEVAAERALSGVLEGRPHVITHGDLVEPVAKHRAEIDDALGRVGAQGPNAGGDMDDVEAIKQLKARYFRLLDTKDWTGFRELFTEDVRVDVSGDGAGVYEGVGPFLEMLEPTLRGVVTVHHGHMPEIQLTSPTTATGIWAMEDELRFPPGGPVAELHGYGHYHETYVKTDGRWRISSTRLSRLRLDVS